MKRVYNKYEQKFLVLRAKNAVRKDDNFNIVLVRKDLILLSLDYPQNEFINELLALVNKYCAFKINPYATLWQIYQIECKYQIK